MIKAWFVCSKDDGTYLTHDDDDVPYEGSADTVIEEGFFVTKEELEQIKREAFEAGHKILYCDGDMEFNYKTFEDYMKDKDEKTNTNITDNN